MIEMTMISSMRVKPFSSREGGRDPRGALARQPTHRFSIAALRDILVCMSLCPLPFIRPPPYVTVNLNDWVAVPAELVAVIVNVYVPAVPLPGVPDSTPVVELSVTPRGRDPEVTA
jgi:hypothetical protein